MNKYTSAFDKIQVTPEMEKRIKETLEKESQEIAVVSKKRSVFQRPARLIYALSACCVLVFVITLSYFLFFNDNNTDPGIAVTNPFKEFTSIDELKGALSFDLKTPKGIPADYEITGISLISGQTVQIRYSNGNDEMTYRVAPGSEDISGDYNEYDFIQIINISGMDITLKGRNDRVYLTTWSDDTFSYSLATSKGMSESLLIEIVSSIAR